MEPGIAYLGGLLWLPRERFDIKTLRNVLTFTGEKSSILGKATVIKAWADKPHHIGVPILIKGDIHGSEFRRMFKDMEIPLKDLRPRTYEHVDVSSQVILDVIEGGDLQKRAVKTLLKHEHGILVLGCGKGKTVIALHAAAQFKAPFIVIVDDKGTQMQWVGEIKRHLVGKDGRPIKVGLVGDGKAEWNAPVVVALIQSIYNKAADLPMEVRRRFCVSIWDECHILGAPEFSKAVTVFMGRRWGLSATPGRADGLERMYYLHLGKEIMIDLHQEIKPVFYFHRIKTIVNEEDPTYRSYVCPSGHTQMMNLFTYLAGIRERTDEIAGLIQQGIQAGRKVLVLSRRLFLLEQLQQKFPEAGWVWSKVTGTVRESIFREKDVILCQMRLGEKAVNKPELDMMIVCEPLKRDAVFQQIIGRLQRKVEGKPTPIVIFIEDYGACLGMTRKLKRVINQWPTAKGGPFKWRYTA